jgi:hypothetical protein
MNDTQVWVHRAWLEAQVGLHSTLSALHQLTRLWVEGDWASNYVLGNRSGVPGLHDLKLSYCPRLKQPVLVGLQCLQQLTRL